MPKVYLRVEARRDLDEHFFYLAENAGLDIAERFLTSTEASFNDLAGQPMIGVLLTLRHPALAGMRKWRIKDFDNGGFKSQVQRVQHYTSTYQSA